MQPYSSTSIPADSTISHDTDLGMPSHSIPTSGSFSPPSTSNPFAFGMPDGEQLQLNPSPVPSAKLSPMFIDRITRESNLTKLQCAELQKMLALGTSLGSGLPLPDLATRVFAMASVFGSENRIVACIAAQGTAALGDGGVDIRSLFKELDIRLEETFHFTKEQTTNIRRVCQDTILNPKMFRFKELHIEVEKKMRREPDSYRMGNVFGQPAREKAFTATTWCIASNIRNAFRQELRDSVMGPTQTSLSIFTVQMAMKYRLGSVIAQLDQGYKIHNALLCRFAYEHKNLLLNKEEEDDNNLYEDDDDEDSSSTGQSRKRKKKSLKKVGRISNGDDFWSKVDSWFEEEIKMCDRDLSGSLWRSYVDDTIKRDNERFDPELAATFPPTSPASGSVFTAQAHPATEPIPTDMPTGPLPSTTDTRLNWTFNSSLGHSSYGTSEVTAAPTGLSFSGSDQWAALMASAEGR